MLQPEKILFETTMTATGGRDGRAESPDGSFKLALSVPKGLGGPGGDGTNPEQLFAPAMRPASSVRSSWWRAPARSRCRMM